MIDADSVNVMEILLSCRCCLKGPPDKRLNTLYTHHGKTEIYSDMLKECFNINLTQAADEGGICEECVCHLRDASCFKLQVQLSQERLERALQVKNEELAIKAEVSQVGNVEAAIHVEPTVKSETLDGETISDDDSMSCEQNSFSKGWPVTKVDAAIHVEPTVKSETLDGETISDDDSMSYADQQPATSDDDTANVDLHDTSLSRNGEAPSSAVGLTDAAGKQLAMTCSVRLERLSSVKCVKCHLTFQRDSSDVTEAHDSFLVRAYTCDTCDGQYTEKYKFIKHKTKQSVSSSTKTHGKSKNEKVKKPFSCDVCNRQFAEKIALQRHQRTHTGEKPYACSSCDKRFTSFFSLKHHQYKHTGVKPHKCTICDKTFTRLHGLKIHKRIHTGDKPHKCEKCHMKFNQLYGLIGHVQRVHTKVKPFTCDICKKQFKTKSYVRLHLMRHERP